MAKVTVLIAAGDSADADELEAWAKADGYSVTARASSGKNAVTLAEARHPDLVLMDTHPGGTMGMTEILKRIQKGSGIPVVLIAASDDDLPALRRSTAPPYGCLVRPFGPRMLRQIVEAAIYRHSRELCTDGKKAYPGTAVRKVAHDINNSLSSALANIQLARRSIAQEEHLCRHLYDAEKSVLRARDHSRQLLVPLGGLETMEGAARKAQHPVAHPRKSPGKKKSGSAGYRILLMDDEDAILSATSDMLSFLGHKVTVAKSGEESVKSYRKAQASGLPFDLVILDITVPGGIGAEETLPRLRETDPNVRAIISSGYATHPLLINFSANGFAAALIKPYGFKELEESLAQASGQK
jgi:CheY-like chemotaxis protein